MSNYEVRLTAPQGHKIPALLESFGTWLGNQSYGSLGCFYLVAEEIPSAWDPETVDRLNRDGFSFLRTPDGSQLVLISTGQESPPAVGMLGSEGETGTIASSLEEFLVLLSKGETSVHDLDREDATGRSKLCDWLIKNKITVSTTPAFDFDAYLDGTPPKPPPATATPGPMPQAIAALPPLLRQVASLVGRRADDPELVAFVTTELQQKVPDSTTRDMKHVVAKKHGIEMGFDHDIKNEKYPLLNKTKKSFVPYLQIVWLKEKLAEPLPFGLEFGMTSEEVTRTLGAPDDYLGQLRIPHWKRILDPVREIVFTSHCLPDKVPAFTIEVAEARDLASSHGEKCDPTVGLFVAWAAHRDLIDESRLPDQEAQVAAVRKRELQGTTLMDAVLPRGLWDVHLKDEPGLRHFAYQWFHNMGGMFIRDDLVEVFGKREGPYGHDEAILDDDTWQAVDKATPALDKRFAEWVNNKPKK